MGLGVFCSLHPPGDVGAARSTGCRTPSAAVKFSREKATPTRFWMCPAPALPVLPHGDGLSSLLAARGDGEAAAMLPATRCALPAAPCLQTERGDSGGLRRAPI